MCSCKNLLSGGRLPLNRFVYLFIYSEAICQKHEGNCQRNISYISLGFKSTNYLLGYVDLPIQIVSYFASANFTIFLCIYCFYFQVRVNKIVMQSLSKKKKICHSELNSLHFRPHHLCVKLKHTT